MSNRSIAFILLIGSYLVSLLLANHKPFNITEWMALALHLATILLIAGYYLHKTLPHRWSRHLNIQELLPLLFIWLVAFSLNFYLLSSYPFVSKSDEVYDAGVTVVHILAGKNTIFDFDGYQAQGLIIPALTSGFYHVFGASVLTYRAPAAILGSLSIIFLYLLTRWYFSRTTAVLSALTLTSLPLQLYFSRTDPVVAFNLFWSPVLLFVTAIVLKKMRTIDYLFLGTLIGFICTFHAAIRVMALVMLLLFVWITVWQGIQKCKKQVWHAIGSKLVLLFSFCLIGYGPQLLYTNPTNFFHTSRFVPISHENLMQKYARSLEVWYAAPASYHYHGGQPLLTPVLVLLLFAGIVYVLYRVRTSFALMTISLVFLLPFFCSAITDAVNADHRVSPMLAVGAFLIGAGLFWISRHIRHPLYRGMFIFVFCSYLSMQLGYFFIKLPANLGYTVGDYLKMHTIYFLNPIDRMPGQQSICGYFSPRNYDNFDGYQFTYFLPNTRITIRQDARIENNAVYLFSGSCPSDYRIAKKVIIIHCDPLRQTLYCPLRYRGELRIHYE